MAWFWWSFPWHYLTKSASSTERSFADSPGRCRGLHWQGSRRVSLLQVQLQQRAGGELSRPGASRDGWHLLQDLRGSNRAVGKFQLG